MKKLLPILLLLLLPGYLWACTQPGLLDAVQVVDCENTSPCDITFTVSAGVNRKAVLIVATDLGADIDAIKAAMGISLSLPVTGTGIQGASASGSF